MPVRGAWLDFAEVIYEAYQPFNHTKALLSRSGRRIIFWEGAED